MPFSLKCLVLQTLFIQLILSQRSRDRPRNYDNFRNEFPRQDVPNSYSSRQNADPCNPSYHRTISNQPRRSYNYRFGSQGPREHALCDRDIAPGWYRFKSLAGNTMPTSCPGTNYCGTRAPVWMKGAIPAVEEGIVKATACVSVQGKCCTTQIPILVKNCSDFTVYHLQPTPACPSAYCAGYEVSCPPGLTSDTGYTPCHFPVDLLETKISYGLTNDNSEVQFFCDVTLGGNVVPDTVALEIEWLADDEVIQSETFGLLEQHKGVLKEDKWFIGQTLQCKARAKHVTINTFTPPQLSKPVITGVLILTSPSLSAVEGAEPTYIEFQTTIPIVCPKKEKPKKKEKDKKEEPEEPAEEEECCVTFDISTSVSSSTSSPRCASGNSFDMVVTDGCSYRVCSYDWNVTHKIPFWAVNDGLFGTDNDEQNPTVVVDIKTADSSPPRWHDIYLPGQEIEIRPADVTQQCVSGYIMQSFDGVFYKNPFEGTFVLYKHTNLPYEIQIYRKKCTFAKLCNCAISVRFGDVMLAADLCTTGKLRFWSYTIDGSYIEPNNIYHLPQFIRMDDGRSFQFQFPTGTRLIFGHNLRLVIVQASRSDFEQTYGLCGSFDDDYSNDFSTYRGQVVCSSYLNKTNVCEDFAKSWRLLTEQSLFVGSFTNDGHTEEDEYFYNEYAGPGHCSCSGSDNPAKIDLRPKSKPSYVSPYEDYQPETETEEETNTCSSSQCVDPRGADITIPLLDLLSEEDFIYEGQEFGTEISSAELYPVFSREIKLGLDLGNSSELTEDAAEVYCRGVIEGMPFTKLCRDIANINIESHILSCKEEIMHTKNTVWSADMLEDLRMICKYQIYHNVSTWEPQLGRKHGTPPLGVLSKLCLNGCSDHGVCENGVCRCENGFSGSDCSVNLSQPPKISAVGFSSTCDIREKECSEILVWGEKFADTDIKCHFDVYTTASVRSVPTFSTTLTTQGKMLTFQSVICDVPDLPVHDAKIASFYIPGEGLEKTRGLLRVRISYGNPSSTSDPLDYTIYDSLCWSCETALGCQPNPTQSCNVLSEPFGSSNDPFHSLPAFSNPSAGFSHASSPLQYSPDTSLGFSPPALYTTNPDRGHPHPSLVGTCSLPKDGGPCRSDKLRYFYDNNVQKCRPFIYGGCQGNSNNFLTEKDCLSTCKPSSLGSFAEALPLTTNVSTHQEASPSNIPLSEKLTLNTTISPADEKSIKCLQGNSPGPCDKEIVRYYYDTVVNKCRPFIYGGCLGNSNNFKTRDECIKDCEVT